MIEEDLKWLRRDIPTVGSIMCETNHVHLLCLSDPCDSVDTAMLCHVDCQLSLHTFPLC